MMELETISTSALEKMLDRAAAGGSRQENVIREELLRRQLESAHSDNGTLPMDYVAKREELRGQGHNV